MSKPVLPIHKISENDFNDDFKKKHLDNLILNESDLKKIEEIFGLVDRSVISKIGRISCDEFHAHQYSCIHYISPESGVVDRLITEIRRYKLLIKGVKEGLDI